MSKVKGEGRETGGENKGTKVGVSQREGKCALKPLPVARSGVS